MTDASSASLENLRFPIGRFSFPDSPVPPAHRIELIDSIAATPANVRTAVEGLSAAQIDTPYRDDGWTVRQVVHHLVDSHANSYCRFKLTMTEEHPTIRTYDEAAWGELQDARTADVDLSLAILDGLHARWTAWLRTLTDADWARTLYHPEVGDLALDQLLAMYGWHGPHHVAHITGLRDRMGW